MNDDGYRSYEIDEESGKVVFCRADGPYMSLKFDFFNDNNTQEEVEHRRFVATDEKASQGERNYCTCWLIALDELLERGLISGPDEGK